MLTSIEKEIIEKKIAAYLLYTETKHVELEFSRNLNSAPGASLEKDYLIMPKDINQSRMLENQIVSAESTIDDLDKQIESILNELIKLNIPHNLSLSEQFTSHKELLRKIHIDWLAFTKYLDLCHEKGEIDLIKGNMFEFDEKTQFIFIQNQVYGLLFLSCQEKIKKLRKQLLLNKSKVSNSSNMFQPANIPQNNNDPLIVLEKCIASAEGYLDQREKSLSDIEELKQSISTAVNKLEQLQVSSSDYDETKMRILALTHELEKIEKSLGLTAQTSYSSFDAGSSKMFSAAKPAPDATELSSTVELKA